MCIRDSGFTEANIKKLLAGSVSNGAIQQIGFLIREINDFYNATSIDEFKTKCMAHGITFMQLTGIIFNFAVSHDFLKLCIDTGPALQGMFMKGARDYMSVPDDMDYSTFKSEILDESGGTKIYSWIFNHMTNPPTTLFFINQNKNPEFTSTSGCSDSTQTSARIALPYQSIKQLQLAKFESPVVLGSAYNMPTKGAVWYKLMEKFGKEIIAGQSASASLTHRLFFVLTNFIERNLTNEILLLLVVLADYSLIFHSFSEVLQAYIPCMVGSGIKYQLSYNDLDFIYQLIESAGLSSRFIAKDKLIHVNMPAYTGVRALSRATSSVPLTLGSSAASGAIRIRAVVASPSNSSGSSSNEGTHSKEPKPKRALTNGTGAFGKPRSKGGRQTMKRQRLRLKRTARRHRKK
jgi:hypothetical protein